MVCRQNKIASSFSPKYISNYLSDNDLAYCCRRTGQAARFGVRENDKLVTINGKTPRNVDDAVGVIKQAGNNIKLVSLCDENNY